MRTPEQLYKYEDKRQKEYYAEFLGLVQELDIPEIKRTKLVTLFEWYGHARAIKSKAYQEMKKTKH